MKLDWGRIAGFRLRLVSAAGQAMGVGRTKGDHLSDTIRWIRGKLDPKFVDDGGLDEEKMSPALFARLMSGFVHELCIEIAFKQWLQHSLIGSQQEIESDGVKMTFDWKDEQGVLWEGKATEKTRRLFDEALALLPAEMASGLAFRDTTLYQGYWPWLKQLMAYCLHTCTTSGNLVVWWKRGTYSRDWSDENGKPDVRVYPFEFTVEELQNEWEDTMRWERARRKELGLA